MNVNFYQKIGPKIMNNKYTIDIRILEDYYSAGLTRTTFLVNKNELSALSILYNTCLKMGQDNINVSIASANPSVWFSDFIDVIIDYVSIITNQSTFQIISLENNRVISKGYAILTRKFTDDLSLRDFIRERGQFGNLVLHSIVKYIDTGNMTLHWVLKYKDISEVDEIRDNKINYVIDNEKEKSI